jgi:hypothetical protein
MVGGDGKYTLKRVVDYGDEWMPIPMRSGDRLAERIQELQRMAEDAGRGPIPVTFFGVQPRAEVVEAFDKMGVQRCVFFIPPAPEEDTLPRLDRYAEMMGEFAKAGA